MRFSILNLVAAIFVVACMVNALLTVTRSRALDKDTTENQIESKLAESNLVNQEPVAKAVAATKLDVEVLGESKRRLLRDFESHVDTRYSLKTSKESLSVIEVPQYRPREIFFIKTYRIYQPESFNAGVRVFFEPRSSMSSDNDNGEFESLDDTVLKLPEGHSKLTFEFYPAGESENECLVAVTINSQEVFSRKYFGQKNRGHSSSNYFFSTQKNYALSDKFPDILNFQPSSGTSAIRMRVIKVDDE